VLWQENSGGGNIDADYFRKAIVIYDMEAAPDAEGKLVPVRTIWLDKYKGVNGRNNRAICISPDGSAVAFFVADGDDSIYRVSDGSVIAEVPAGPTVAWSPDGSLFATGTYLQNDPVQVWSTASGKLVSSTAATGEIRTLAISPDNHRLYVGWNTSTLECFDVSSGASVSKIKTPISPLAISPRGDRFLGFLPDSDTHGSIVLGSLPAAETILVLNEGAHVLNRAYFSASGDAIACTISRDYAALGRSLSVKHATQLLNQLTPFVPTAEVVPRAAKFPSAANP
jgi:WD40 repeat protein